MLMRPALATALAIAITLSGCRHDDDTQRQVDDALRVNRFDTVRAHYDRSGQRLRLTGEVESIIDRAHAERVVRQATDSALPVQNDIHVFGEAARRYPAAAHGVEPRR